LNVLLETKEGTIILIKAFLSHLLVNGVTARYTKLMKMTVNNDEKRREEENDAEGEFNRIHK